MSRRLWPAIAILLLLCAGCDKSELTQFGFVQAAAVDLTENGQYALTTLFYNPSGGGNNDPVKERKKGIVISTEADTMFEAVRDIPIVFGRKAKWDHMRVLLIGEQAARTKDVKEVLDHYFRDHEPRSTVRALISKGRAADYLTANPFIENTIGEQLKSIQDMSVYSSKTIKVRMLDLAIQLKNQTGVAEVPYLYRTPDREIAVAGIALLKDGRLTNGILPSDQTKSLVMLLNEYRSGIIEIPCDEAKEEGTSRQKKETFEVIDLKTSIQPRVKGKELTFRVDTAIRGSVGQLVCSTVGNDEDERSFESRLVRTVESELSKVISVLQRRRLDALGLGDRIYRRNPSLWKQLKPDWETVFAEGKPDIRVTVEILDTGMTVGKPLSKL